MAYPNYTVVEANNVAMGQAGVDYLTDTDTYTPPSGMVVVAIQFVDDSAFTTLTPSTSDFIGTAGGSGDAIDSDNVFPAGMVIYGQWTAFTLSSGSVIAYQGSF